MHSSLQTSLSDQQLPLQVKTRTVPNSTVDSAKQQAVVTLTVSPTEKGNNFNHTYPVSDQNGQHSVLSIPCF